MLLIYVAAIAVKFLYLHLPALFRRDLTQPKDRIPSKFFKIYFTRAFSDRISSISQSVSIHAFSLCSLWTVRILW